VRGEHHACPHRHRRSQQFTLNEYPYCDGGYAEYYYLPPGHYVFTVPDVLPDEAIPPVNCALCQVLHGIEYAGMKFGDIVVIQGAGGLGIYACAVAADKGASRVIAIDRQTPRLAMARNCGATDVIDMNELPTAEARVQRVKELTDGRGADIVVEVVGIAAATVEGLDMVRFNGTFVDIGNIVPQTITLPAAATLSGSVTDDGLPSPPGAVTTTWSKVSGPGAVTFGNPAATVTTATFSETGVYTLSLTASDTEFTVSDDVVITVILNATLTLDPALAGPNVIGASQTLLATLKNSGGAPIAGAPAQFVVTGPNATSGSATTDAVTRAVCKKIAASGNKRRIA